MMAPSPTGLAILWPTIALVLLVFVMAVTLVRARFGHMKRQPPAKADFETGAAAMRYFEPVEMPANNLANLFQMPVLYFALVPLLLLTGLATAPQVVLGWSYFVLRALHSEEHVARRAVIRRFQLFLASTAVLAAMWIGFAIDVARM